MSLRKDHDELYRKVNQLQKDFSNLHASLQLTDKKIKQIECDHLEFEFFKETHIGFNTTGWTDYKKKCSRCDKTFRLTEEEYYKQRAEYYQSLADKYRAEEKEK